MQLHAVAPDRVAATGTGCLGPVVKSAGRTLQILEFFDTVRREASVLEIARALGLPQSSTSALLQSLVSLGYLQQDRLSRTYFPTRRVSLLGHWVDSAMVQEGRLLETVDDLALRTGQTVVMATANGRFAQYIYVAQPRQAPPIPIGALLPVASTATGRALLAQAEESNVAAILRRLNADSAGEGAPIAIRPFLDALRSERARGYFTGPGATEGTAGLAIIAGRDRQHLVLGIEGSPEAIRGCERRFSDQLHGSAGTLARHPRVA